MFQTWHDALRGVVVYRWGVVLLVLSAASSVLVRVVGAPFDALEKSTAIAAMGVCLAGVGLFAFRVPLWAPVARGVGGVTVVPMLAALALAVWQSSINVGSYSVSAFEQHHTVGQVSVVCLALAMVLVAWAWRAASETTSDRRPVWLCNVLMMVTGVSGLLSLVQTFDSFDGSLVLPASTLAIKAALLGLTWHASNVLRLAVLPRG